MRNDTERLILASGSPRRKELLEQIGFTPVVIPSDVEEVITCTEPDRIVEELSLQKCQSVAAKQTGDAMVLGADTVVALDGKILGKPGSEEGAAQMLRLLSGKEHQVYTGVTLIAVRDGKEAARRTFSCGTRVFVAELKEEEIRDYIATGEPMDKAGAYGIQGYFARYIPKIIGDYANVVGLPVARVYEEWKALQADL